VNASPPAAIPRMLSAAAVSDPNTHDRFTGFMFTRGRF
jgi:hypothetical protein